MDISLPVPVKWFWEFLTLPFSQQCLHFSHKRPCAGRTCFTLQTRGDRSVTKAAGSASFCFESVGNPWMSRSMNVLSTSLCKFALRFYLPFRTCMPSTTGGHELTPAIKGTFQDVWGVLMHLKSDGHVEGILRRAGSSNMFQLILLHDLICLLTLRENVAQISLLVVGHDYETVFSAKVYHWGDKLKSHVQEAGWTFTR